MTLLLRPSLRGGEGPLGYLFRLAEANGLGLAALRDLGVQFDLETLYSLGYLPSGFLGSSVGEHAKALERLLVGNPQSWNREVPRYCPKCLMDNGYWRFGWETVFIDACPDHHVWLLDRCSACKQVLSWQRSELLRCACGASLACQESSPCPHTVARLSGALVHCIIPRDENAPIPLVGFISLPQLQRLIRLLAAYGDTAAGPRPQKIRGVCLLDVSWNLTSLAGEILDQWPQSFFAMLHGMEDSSSALGAGRLSGRFGHFYFLLYRAFSEPEFDFLRRAFEEFISEHWRGSFGARNRRLFANLPKQLAWIPAKHARQVLGLSQRRLADLMRAGRITGDQRLGQTGRRFLVVRRADVDAEAARKDSDVDLFSAARLLGMKKKRVASLLSRLIPEARRTGEAGCPWSIPRETIDRLLEVAQSTGLKEAITGDEVSFAQVLRGWPWSEDAIADFMLAILDGEISTIGRLPDHTGVTGLVFWRKRLHEWHASIQQQVKSVSLSVPEAAERLAVKQEVAYLLVRKGLINAQVVRNGRRKEARISPGDLSSFDERYVFCRDLAATLNTSPRSLADKLYRLGIQPVSGPGVDACRQLVYERGDVLDCALDTVARGNRAAGQLERIALGGRRDRRGTFIQ